MERGVGKKINFKISIPRDKERRVQITLIISSPISPPTPPISCTPLCHLTFSPLPFLPPIESPPCIFRGSNTGWGGERRVGFIFLKFPINFHSACRTVWWLPSRELEVNAVFFIFIKNNHFTVYLYSFVLQSFKYVFGILLKWKKKTRFILTSLVRYREKTRN